MMQRVAALEDANKSIFCSQMIIIKVSQRINKDDMLSYDNEPKTVERDVRGEFQ